MKNCMTLVLSLILLGTYGLLCAQAVLGAELLDVRPYSKEGVLSVEITANMSMTYMYGGVPGQARFVVDIANVNPEKVEPLIVVNKGAVASISVDKVHISGIMVSRIAFSLTTEAEAKVTASPDRKKLIVTFKSSPGDHAAVSGRKHYSAPPVAQTAEEYLGTIRPNTPPSKIKDQATAKSPIVTEQKTLDHETPTVAKPKEIDPSPPVKPVPLDAAPVARKPESLLPVAADTKPLIRGITIGEGFIDVQADGPVQGFRTMELKRPSRLAIDIKGAKLIMTAKVVVINRFGISKARVGLNPGFVRIVLDAAKSVVPKYSIVATDNGLRIKFE